MLLLAGDNFKMRQQSEKLPYSEIKKFSVLRRGAKQLRKSASEHTNRPINMIKVDFTSLMQQYILF